MEIEHSDKFNGFVTKGGNYVWGGALGLAWNEIIDSFTKQPVKVISNNPQVQKIVENFNTSKFSRKDIDDRCIYVKSGYDQETVTKINTQCKKKFPQKSFGDLKIEMGPKDIISYAYLLKKLEFQVKFQRVKERKFLFEGKQVPSFFTDNKKQRKQVNWYMYKGKDEFLISIDSKKPDDQIFFIKSDKVKTVDDAINLVTKYGSKQSQKMDQDDKFQMPVVQLDVKRNVTELEGLSLGNKSLDGYIFGVVYEAIKLKIDEAGAKVQNQAVIMMLKCCIMKKPQPKYFIFDKQYWVVMKEKGKHPYFVALIKNPQDL